MKTIFKTTIMLLLLVSSGVYGQRGIGTNTPDKSAILELASTSKGFLLPRLTTVQRDAIVSPVAGLAVYCTDCGSGEISFFNGAIWSGSTVTTPGAPGIGTATPGNTQATVGYTAPAANGGSVITTYTATASPGGFTGTVTQAGSGAITVTGLTNDTAYTFTVTATNTNGTGTASAVSNSVTPVDPIPFVTSTTGRIWMDRNLGATQVATSSTDAASYGDLYQWGRASDGHQSRTSTTTTTTVTSATAGPVGFITVGAGTDYNWTDYGSEDDLWQSGLNDPCPPGYGIPTETELENERDEWSGPNYATDAYNSALKLPLAGYRNGSNGTLGNVDSNGNYWSSTVSTTYARYLRFDSSFESMHYNHRAYGFSVRCIKEVTTPGAPVIGTATPGNAQATVGYTAPADTGGSVITTYTATASPGGFTGTVTQAGSGTITVTGLTNGTGYTFTVTATNGIGTGTASAVSNSVTPVIPNVTSTTGRIWMDRNLGATQVATSSTDAASYGDLYQWGRASDGHQSRTSTTTATTVTSATAGPVGFITVGAGTDYNWTDYGNEDDLWQSGLNDPCPPGYGIPTETELEKESDEWSGPNYATDAYNSALKLPLAGYRSFSGGSLNNVDSNGRYWSSTVVSTNARNLSFGSSIARMDYNFRANGNSVRCIKDL